MKHLLLLVFNPLTALWVCFYIGEMVPVKMWYSFHAVMTLIAYFIFSIIYTIYRLETMKHD